MSETPFNNVTFDMPKSQSNSIKVIGVGGGGSNAVNHMFMQDIHGVDFVICNTDAQALQSSPIPNKVQLGASLTSGLGAGANPEVGGKAAEESIEEIKLMLNSQTKMVFITAGMGGGTGTGAAPIIAGIAKKMDILTVGIVTMPFQFEGKMRAKQAQKGIDSLRENVDSLIVINNNKLREVYGNLGFKAGFSKADEVLSTAATGIAEVITHHYKQNIDLHDAKTVLSNSGTAIMGSAKEAGENRGQNAIMKALDSPLLNDNKIRGAKNVLLLIVSGKEEVTLDEIGEINDFIQEEAGYDANIIMGVGEDEELDDAIAVTVVATGFAIDQQREITNTEVKKVYHTLNTEQTAHYSFEKEEPFSRTRVKKAPEVEQPQLPVEEKKVVHQLFEEEEIKKTTLKKEVEEELMTAAPIVEETVETAIVEGEAKSEVTQEEVEAVCEDDFVINDITLDLFSSLEEKPKEEAVNVFDLPVNQVEEVSNEEVEAEAGISIAVSEPTVQEEAVSEIADEVPVQGEEIFFEAPKKTIYSLEDEEEVVEDTSSKNEVEEDDLGIKRYDLNDFDEEKKVVSPSSVKVNEVVASKPEEEITYKIQRKAVAPEKVEEEVSPLNLTISELRKTSERRKSTMKKYNHRFKNTAFNEDLIEDIEKEPAYKRQGLDLHVKQDADKISRTSVNGEGDDLTIRRNNSFLHDNVD